MRVLRVATVALLVTIVFADRYHPDREDSVFHRNTIAYNRNTDEQNKDYWKNEAVAAIQKRIEEMGNNKIAKNLILFLGDGMSIPTMTAARTLKGQRENRTGEESQLFFESFPTVGLSKTYCLNQQIPDSGCTATAYLTGVKNNGGTIGVTGAVPRHDCLASLDKSTHLDSIAVWALEDGRDAGVVTNTRITHASPAAAFARAANRHWEGDADIVNAGFTTDQCPDIAHQLIHTSPGNNFKVILGGGRRNFFPTTQTDEEGDAGSRTDGRNLIDEWQKDKQSRGSSYKYVWNRSELLNLRNSPPEYLLGLFDTDHLQYNLRSDKVSEPTLEELTEVAINSLSRNEKGFFLFVESGRIDHAHHDNWPELALDETIEFDKAIKKAVEISGEDTLIVVTADHTHVMTFNGMSVRGKDILGPSDSIGLDNVPYMTLSYTNGPGARTIKNNVRPDVTIEEDYKDSVVRGWMAPAHVPLESETHGGDDVAVLAHGPHHHMFSGVYEQSQIPWLMAYAACIGPGVHSEYCDTRNSGVIHQPLVILYIFAFSFMFRTFL